MRRRSSGVVTTAPSGRPLPIGLPSTTMSGTTPCVSKPQKCVPSRPKPICTSSAMQTPPAAAHVAVRRPPGSRAGRRSGRRRSGSVSARNAATLRPPAAEPLARSCRTCLRVLQRRPAGRRACSGRGSRPASAPRARSRAARSRPGPSCLYGLTSISAVVLPWYACSSTIMSRRPCAARASRRASSFASLPELSEEADAQAAPAAARQPLARSAPAWSCR